MTIIYFSYVDLPRLRPLNDWLVKAKGISSYVSIVPILVLEAFDSTTKVFLKSDAGRTGVVHMDLFNSMNSCSAAGVQWNALFLRRSVNGLAIFP